MKMAVDLSIILVIFQFYYSGICNIAYHTRLISSVCHLSNTEIKTDQFLESEECLGIGLVVYYILIGWLVGCSFFDWQLVII
jgi:hypothetical protein